MNLNILIDIIAEAIARKEGFYKPGSLARRQNNPGNLRSWGDTPITKGYAAFVSLDKGWKALRKQILLNINRELTFYEFFSGKPGVYSGYSPAKNSNNPTLYAIDVASAVGQHLGKVIDSKQTVIKSLTKVEEGGIS